MHFTKVEAIPVGKYPAQVVVRWETSLSGADLKDYEFCVMKRMGAQDARPDFQNIDIDGKPVTPKKKSLKSENLQPASTWIDGLDFPWFSDFSDNLMGLSKVVFYKVVCRNKKTQESFTSVEFSWSNDLDLIGLYICDEVNFLLHDATGVPSLFYQRRRGGVKCTECFDPIQKKRTKSFCTNCYGTNWERGFYNPLDTYIDFSPVVKNASVEVFGETNNNNTNALMANFPNASPGDVIREIPSGKMWRVVAVSVTEKRRCQMLQMLNLTEIKSGDVEYTLAADPRFIAQKITELNQVKKLREF